MDVRSPWGKGDDLFEASPMPMMVLDHFGKVIATNQALIALGDFSKTDIATWQKPPLVVESTDGLTRDFFDHVMTQGQPTGVAFLLLSQDRTLEVDYTISTVGEGSDTLHMVTLSDISDSKCLACRIVKSRDKFRRAVDDTAEFLCRLTPQGIVKFGNLGFANLVARDPWDLPGQPISSLLDKPAVDDLMAFLASFKSTLPIRDYRLTLSDGHGLQRHCWLRVRALFNADGRPDLFSISGRDISAQVEAELQAETRDRMLSAVIDHAPTATILWDDHNRIQRHNRAAPSLFGLRERDFRIGTTALGLVEKLIDRGQLDPGDADPRAYEEDLMR
ncbi:MAG: PAS domain-containing protein, partial [Rhodospirillaceae bacterium]